MQARQLPIYNKTRQFVEEIVQLYERIKVLHKFRIGAYIYDKSLGLSWYIIKANRSADNKPKRVEHLEDYLDDLDCINNAIRIAMDCRVIDIKAHARLSEKIVELSKQATAWKNK